MTVFLGLMAAGLTGLVVMALPAFGHHADIGTSHGFGHAGHTDLPIGHGSGAAHIGGAASGPAISAHPGAPGTANGPTNLSMARFIPSPRMIFSFMVLYGAFGNVFREALHMPMVAATLGAIVPAVLLERFVVTPLWNAMLSAQGTPSSPLENLTLCEAKAVTPFRNGKGIVTMERDGRAVQFSAQLLPDQAHMPVQVGDRLRVEEVDAARERMTVTLLH